MQKKETKLSFADICFVISVLQQFLTSELQ